MGIYAKNFDGVWFGVACEDERVYATNFAFDEKSVLRGLKDSFSPNVILERPSRVSGSAERVLGVLKDVYDGKDVANNVPLNFDRLSSYTKRVIEAVCMIPVGYVSSYGLVAKAVGGAPRAVGHVMATNPYAPLCPCHRVVGSDFGLCGYGGGLSMKLAFLRREKRGFPSELDIAIGKGKLHVFPVERVLEKARRDKR